MGLSHELFCNTPIIKIDNPQKLCYPNYRTPDFKGSSCEKRHTKVQGFLLRKAEAMETRLAIIAIVVEKAESVERLNQILHEYGDYIIGRMGIPHRERDVNLISIAIDAPQNDISSLSGKLGMLEGVTAKAVYSKV